MTKEQAQIKELNDELVKEHIRRYVQDRCERGEKAIYTDNYEKAEIADITGAK